MAKLTRYPDDLTGLTVSQLTDRKAHSHHLYFTNPGWFDESRRLLFSSDRTGTTNLFSFDSQRGQIMQESDLPRDGVTLRSCLNPTRNEAYVEDGQHFYAIDLQQHATRPLCEVTPGFENAMANVTADGRYLVATLYEDLSERFDVDLLHGYVGFREIFEARPLSRVVKIDTQTGELEVVHEDRHWFGHLNTSPKHAHLATYCHEGPWHLVAQRIWGCNLDTGEVWPIRPQSPREQIGHEYWLADGEHIGYHGHIHDDDSNAPDTHHPVFGIIRYDNSEMIELPFPYGSHHFHSNTRDLIVGDGPQGSNFVVLWRREGDQYVGPRALCRHGSSRFHQAAHVHPRFSPDGSQVLFTSDRSSYCQVYQVDVPDFDTLPDAPAN